MDTRNPTQKPRFKIVYQAWSDDDRPAVRLTPLGGIVADDVIAASLKTRLVKDCNCKKAKK